jgi:hypothetical protein
LGRSVTNLLVSRLVVAAVAERHAVHELVKPVPALEDPRSRE